MALVSYTLLILLRNIVTGLDSVPAATREAADGMGFEGWRRMLFVDIPLAAPVIIAGPAHRRHHRGPGHGGRPGRRGGLGELITEGLGRSFSTPIVVGAVLSIALVVLDLAFLALEWVLTPWGRARAQGW